MTLNAETAEMIVALVRELSTEIDLHYDDVALHSTKATIGILRQASRFLADHGGTVPDECVHVLARFDHTEEAGR